MCSPYCFEDSCVFFFQAEDGIRELVRSRGLGDVYKRQALHQRVRDGKLVENPGDDEIDHLRHALRVVVETLSLIHI